MPLEPCRWMAEPPRVGSRARWGRSRPVEVRAGEKCSGCSLVLGATRRGRLRWVRNLPAAKGQAMKYIVIALACLSLTAVSAHCQEPDLIKEKLDRAKAEYSAEVDKARQGVLDALQKREDAARQSGDKKAVDEVKAERQAFEEKGALPKSVATAAY